MGIFQSNTDTQATSQRIEFIDALRAIAVLGVIFIHIIGGSVGSFVKPIGFIILHGSLGVQLFFLLSGFSMFLTLKKATTEKPNFKAFYMRRIFRIAPFYFLLLVLILYIRGFFSGMSIISPINVLAHFLFIDSFHPDWMLNGIIGVEWTLSVEMAFYALMPIFYRYIKNRNQAITAFGISVVIGWIYGKMVPLLSFTSDPQVQSVFIDRSLLSQLPIFILGFLLYYLVYPKEQNNIRGKRYFPLVSILLAVIIFLIKPPSIMLLAGLMFFILAYLLSKFPVTLIVNKITTYIGRISYSMYLLHLMLGKGAQIILDYFKVNLPPLWQALVLISLTLTITISVSSFTYYFIEKPFIALGKKLIRKMRQKENTPAYAGVFVESK